MIRPLTEGDAVRGLRDPHRNKVGPEHAEIPEEISAHLTLTEMSNEPHKLDTDTVNRTRAP